MAACGAPGAGKENGGDGNSQNETPEPAERITPAAGSTGATQRRRRHGEEARTSRTGRTSSTGRSMTARVREGRFEDGALQLPDARADEGWNVDVEERTADKI